MPKIELEIDDVDTLIRVLREHEEVLIRHGNRPELERFDRTAKQVRMDLQKWQKENEWVEFETPLGTFAVNRNRDVTIDGKQMAPGCDTIIFDVKVLVEKAFPND